ncbi:beta-lactamase/transpeptidase-like protein [Daedaleopsis nitida]|nr:beta-lactamase/transpeptidase-like protein [Daedaleopsis nitida]
MRSSPSLEGFALVTLAALLHATPSRSLDARASQAPISLQVLESAQVSATNVCQTRTALTPEVSAYAKSLLVGGLLPGLSVGVVHLDNGSVSTEFGTWGNMTEDGDPVKPEAFLVSALGILMDDFANGRNATALPPTLTTLSWDTEVKALLPDDWQLDQEWATEKANLRDILTHVSGLTRHDASYSRSDTPMSLVRKMRHLRAKYELRQRWSYNNLMYITGAHIVSTYSGTPFRDFVQERIFGPLDMTSTTYRANEAETSGLLSQGWGLEGRRIPYQFTGDTLSEFVAGAGGILSNTIDMVLAVYLHLLQTKWLAMLLNKGVDPHTNRTVVPRLTFDEMTTAHSVVDGSPPKPNRSIAGYGMGWMRLSVAGHDMITHNGGLRGFLTDVSFLPGDNIGIVTLTNSDSPHHAESLLPARIIEDYLGLPHSSTLTESAEESTSVLESGVPTDLDCSSDGPGGIAIEKYAGEWFSPGYGTLMTLCSPSSTAPACARILADWRSVAPDGQLAPDTLYGGTDRVWAQNLRMRRKCSTSGSRMKAGEELFVVDSCTIFPEGYGRNSTAFANMLGAQSWDVECAVDDAREEFVGCGIMGMEEDPQWEGESIRERADVWLWKVASESF